MADATGRPRSISVWGKHLFKRTRTTIGVAPHDDETSFCISHLFKYRQLILVELVPESSDTSRLTSTMGKCRHTKSRPPNLSLRLLRSYVIPRSAAHLWVSRKTTNAHCANYIRSIENSLHVKKIEAGKFKSWAFCWR